MEEETGKISQHNIKQKEVNVKQFIKRKYCINALVVKVAKQV